MGWGSLGLAGFSPGAAPQRGSLPFQTGRDVARRAGAWGPPVPRPCMARPACGRGSTIQRIARLPPATINRQRRRRVRVTEEGSAHHGAAAGDGVVERRFSGELRGGAGATQTRRGWGGGQGQLATT
jgi:hypothetical protein